MTIGDNIFIRNNAGKLQIDLIEKLSTRDVFVGMGGGALPKMEQPRLEAHHDKYGNFIVTLCDRCAELPADIYVMFLEAFEEVEVWRGVYHEEERAENVYETAHYE